MRYRRVYIGNLPKDCHERELKNLCREFGRIRDIRCLAGYAFVEFEDDRDARDCVHTLDGERYARASRPRPSTRIGELGRPTRTSLRAVKATTESLYLDSRTKSPGSVVEFSTSKDVDEALRLFDNFEYRGNTITIREDPPAAAADPKTRVMDRVRSVSPPQSPKRDRSRSPRRLSRSPRR
ncbi:hypothetical protein DFJ77DRAFT_361402 [Powellomyces hirtus]|nr:hypothetical protein DFJ77DRAFT_361402 [Powellomyces hirtus]